MYWREIELIEELRRRRDLQASAARWAFEKLSVVQSGTRRRAIPFLAFGVLAGAGVAVLLFFWTQLLRPDDLGAASLPLVAFVAAIASTFNPCGLPALPGFFTFTGSGQDLSRGRRSRLSLSVSLGAISIILLFAFIALLSQHQRNHALDPERVLVPGEIGGRSPVQAARGSRLRDGKRQAEPKHERLYPGRMLRSKDDRRLRTTDGSDDAHFADPKVVEHGLNVLHLGGGGEVIHVSV